MNGFQVRIQAVVGALVVGSLGWVFELTPAQATNELVNISLEGSPNATNVGLVDPDSATTAVPLGGEVIIGGYRSRDCGDPAPDFERFMRQQVGYGLAVPDGLTLFDGGVGHYESGRCGGRVEARAIGARAVKPGTYQVQFFGGKVTKTVEVRSE